MVVAGKVRQTLLARATWKDKYADKNTTTYNSRCTDVTPRYKPAFADFLFFSLVVQNKPQGANTRHIALYLDK